MKEPTPDCYICGCFLISKPRYGKIKAADVKKISYAIVDAVEEAGFMLGGGFHRGDDCKNLKPPCYPLGVKK